MTPSDAEVRRWVAAIRANPGVYRLDAYGPQVTVERAACYFATWAGDQAAGSPSPALCRRCGYRLEATQPGQQLHPGCTPPVPSAATA
ncbi:hypothetical protein [Pseudonocardia sp. KRD291]|uniref:hypothetical protein n=1 Tax=Pseudonocardia sp. KRD291 TaxID=2792007 RepID=UPI001C4A60E1|nr:hypothetical protein [Pseudonocardia sp. KRD291]MBW0104306.1 hypothetical protein [Pseudonocardia sp. KRD291]